MTPAETTTGSNTPPSCVNPSTLAQAGACVGKRVGVSLLRFPASDPRYLQTFNREFDSFTPENDTKWDTAQPDRGNWNHQPGEELLAMVSKPVSIKGHTLVWHNQLPDYVNGINDPGQLRQMMRDHIREMITHYQGRMFAWDVVNEVVNEDGSRRNSVFQRVLGDGYVAEAFQMARDVGADIELYYNDFNIETDSEKGQAAYDLVSDLASRGLVDGVGFQLHIESNLYPGYFSPNAFRNWIRMYDALGLTVNISEMDVRIPSTSLQDLEIQRDIYYDFVRVCVEEPACDAITIWGITDNFSWQSNDDPLLYRENYQAKPAYLGVMDALTDPL